MAIENSPVLQITDGEWTSERYFDILGDNVMAFFTSDPALLTDYVSSFQTRSDDVFVVTYPKSGTTWLQEIVWQILNEGIISNEKILVRFPLLELALNDVVPHTDPKTMPSPRLMKSHLSYKNTPKSASKDTQCKYIYVARNPKDVAVSYFQFVRSLIIFSNGYNGPWEFFLKLFMEGNVCCNCWNDHVLGWWEHRDDSNVLFLKYEDLQKDLPFQVRMIAEFLNKPLTDELINGIAEQCRFKAMENNPSFKVTDEKDSPSFLRKGVVGDWNNFFTQEQNERFEKEVLEKLKGSGLEFDFEI